MRLDKNTTDLLHNTVDCMTEYLTALNHKSVFPTKDQLNRLTDLELNLPYEPTDPHQILQLLHSVGSDATVATASGRYFGFVIGGALPSALAANCLSAAWDQCAGLQVLSPFAEKIELVAGDWIKQLLGFPEGSGVGFVTGATMGNFTGLAAARHDLLKRLDWNVEADGLFGAPEIQVVVGEEVHVSVLKALSLLGLGNQRVVKIPVDDQGRMRTDAFDFDDMPTIVCLQAGNVNTGSFDPMNELIPMAKAKNAWVHIDGAFGLWAAASNRYRHLTKGMELADSWSVDLHKWLNVPYDSGLVICRHPEKIMTAMSLNAAYFPPGAPGPYQLTPGMSRKARGVEAYAALLSLGTSGVEALINNCSKHAQTMANELQQSGYKILNQVVLNQVLVDFGENTEQIIEAIQQDGVCWAGGTVWQGTKAMRISVSNWATTDEDVERSLKSMLKVARKFE